MELPACWGESPIEIDALQLALIGGATIVAAVLRSFTGFGFALAAVPIFSLLLPPAEVVVLSASLAMGLGLLSWRSYWGLVTVRQLAPLLLMALLGTFLGALALSALPVGPFQVCVGVAVLLTCVGMQWSPTGGGRPSAAVPYGVGLLSGLMNGALAIPGPPVIVYTLLAEPEPARSRALMMAFFSASAVIALSIFAWNGLVRQQTLTLAVLILPALYVGDKCGAWLFHRYADGFYRRVAFLMLVVLGVSIIARGLL